ncbi:Uncharacterised protein [Mycobacterium tuberculosis]|nr:Uncharacterised protein [Mycobacterium tuberculosis]COX23569.1 Uncharacterised protein [Mycobacterium tuberculosis]COY21253.1 Uncharacterised protein [Mycobacterium tuberculosis]
MIFLGARLFEFGDGVIGALYVGGVVLAVVKLVDLTRDVRFQCSVVPVQVWQGVFGHGIPSFDEMIVRCFFSRGCLPRDGLALA